MEFKPFSKIPRLSREVVITEKIDGTNGQILIWQGDTAEVVGMMPFTMPLVSIGDWHLWAGSRNRWLSEGKQDNYGFAAWVKANAEELLKLGEGRHFGEWWGLGIQRSYDLKEKRFSLFRVPKDGQVPACCSVVPLLGKFDTFSTTYINDVLRFLEDNGSQAAPGFMKPEGIVIYHTASGQMFKKTIENDEKPKNANPSTDNN